MLQGRGCGGRISRVRRAGVAGDAAVDAGEGAGGAAHGRGVDAAHGAGDGEAGADVGQGLARDPLAGARAHGRTLVTNVEASTSPLTQGAANLCEKQCFVRRSLKKRCLILPAQRPEGCRCSWFFYWRSPSCW